jgi:hypothetical protein
MEKIKKIGGAILAGVVIGAAGMGIGAVAFPKEVPGPVVKEVVEVPGPTVVETVEVVKEVPVNVTVEVPVDNGNLDMVLEHVYDNDGKVQYLTDDLDDDEVDQIVERIAFVNDIKALAVAEVEAEGADELDKEVFKDADGKIEFDEDDIDRFRVQDDDDEVVIDDIDFEDKDADVLVTVKVEQDDEEFNVTYLVEVKDGEVDDIEVESIERR